MIDYERLKTEAYTHGRTLEQLTMALKSLQRIRDYCQQATRKPNVRLLCILTEADTTLKLLSEKNGGVINDEGVPE